jgi:signal peptidase II
MKIENKKTWVGVFILILIEQGIKIIINSRYFNKTFPILPPLLYFEPMFNRHYSWVNSMLRLGVSKGLHIAIVVILSIFLYLFYGYINKRLGTNKIINVMFAFIFSGALCSLADKVFWNGSLDYVLVKGFFTFDLKDVYIDIFCGLMILLLLSKNKILKQLDDKDVYKDFIKYIFRKTQA